MLKCSTTSKCLWHKVLFVSVQTLGLRNLRLLYILICFVKVYLIKYDDFLIYLSFFSWKQREKNMALLLFIGNYVMIVLLWHTWHLIKLHEPKWVWHPCFIGYYTFKQQRLTQSPLKTSSFMFQVTKKTENKTQYEYKQNCFN